MNKSELLQALHKSYDEATGREANYRQYRTIKNTIQSEKEATQKVPFMARVKHAAIPLIVFIVVGTILDSTATPNVSFIELSFFSKILAIITFVSLILTIVLMVNAGKAYYLSDVYTNKMAELAKRSQALEEDLGVKIGMSYLKSHSFLPELTDELHSTFTLGKLITYLEGGRADNLKEALAAYDADCHRMRMEDTQNRILQEAKQQTEILNQMANDYYYNKYNS